MMVDLETFPAVRMHHTLALTCAIHTITSTYPGTYTYMHIYTNTYTHIHTKTKHMGIIDGEGAGSDEKGGAPTGSQKCKLEMVAFTFEFTFRASDKLGLEVCT